MSKSIYNQVEWIALFESGGMPDIYVNVSNFQARIFIRDGKEYIDITDDIPNGEKLAIDAVKKAGGGINISGWYPPTDRIIKAIQAMQKQK